MLMQDLHIVYHLTPFHFFKAVIFALAIGLGVYLFVKLLSLGRRKGPEVIPQRRVYQSFRVFSWALLGMASIIAAVILSVIV